MTTKVNVTCPQNSHWPIVVFVQDQVWDAVNKRMTGEWQSVLHHVLKQGESLPDTYVHSSRRLIIEEIPV